MNEKTKVRLPLYYFVVAVILSAISFFLLLQNFKVYRSEVSFIFVPQSGAAISQTNFISSNISKLPNKLNFYEKLLSDNKDVADSLAGLSPNDRKNIWNRIVEVKRENGSTIFNIYAVSKDFKQSQLLAKQTAHTLFDVLSQYYNVKTDINLRIVDGPVTSVQAQGLTWILMASLALGFAGAFVVYFIFSSRKSYSKSCRLAPAPAKKTHSKREIIENEAPSEEFTYAPKRVEKQAAAPFNLPTEENIYIPYENEEEFHPGILEKESHENKVKNSEPTEEELKERLNQLLRGEL